MTLMSNFQHSLIPFMQDLCLSPTTTPKAHRWAGVCAIVSMGFVLWFAHPAQANTVHQDDLYKEAQQWVAQQHALPTNQIELRPMDARITVAACSGGWTFDAPFPLQTSVRAICEAPKAQMFIQWSSQQVKLVMPEPAQSAAIQVPATRQALAASRTLPRGSHLDVSMVEWVTVEAQQWSAHHLGDLSVIEGNQLMRDMMAGQIIRRQDIRPSVLVKKGHMVSFQAAAASNFTITATVQAMQDGRMGEQIRLKNPNSGRIISGVVTGLNAVRNP